MRRRTKFVYRYETNEMVMMMMIYLKKIKNIQPTQITTIKRDE